MADVSRREFLVTGLAAAGTSLVSSTAGAQMRTETAPMRTDAPPGRPVVISSGNGLRATERAMQLIVQGQDPLHAVVEGVVIVEEDPKDQSVGYGGLPNEDGIVELDASVMHGPTHRGGAVAALRNIKTPSRVAKLVMERTDHVLLVGEGALRFARAHGFEEVNLLTEESRRMWLKWKEHLSDEDDWIPPEGETEENGPVAALHPSRRTYGTINCCAVDAAGNLAGVTTTSGLAFKIPGRVGDSPIIGAGLYVDNEVGAAGATGRGEAVILSGGSRSVVEHMRRGLSPQDACLEVLHYIAAKTLDPRLLNAEGRPNFGVTFYAVAKDGRFGSASLWSRGQYAVFAEGRNRLESCAYLYESPPEKPRPEKPKSGKRQPNSAAGNP
ncbi:MAG TPA: N(4)-(beta-N-acetylglucosaminyl)-L-asparaginase [Phycisphaerae bacterium]|nr:N(4)-(beta-N-acetylglucosaminyl)-L-asparaginase [Phycisphaerae bacterium]HNU46448.1 N(4)-(beta-N-acetylglucosaminyl)-L-asparaginase [Phycisphaerae bacterium]